MNRADMVRFVTIIAPAFVLMGLALSSFIEYSKAYLLDRKIAKATGRPVYGLLPRHVATIGASYICMLAYVLFDVLGRLGRPPRHAFIVLAAFGIYIGLYAMWTIVHFERKRHTDATP